MKASILVGILFCTFIAWIPGHDASYFGEDSPVPGGEARYTYFRKVHLCMCALACLAGRVLLVFLDTELFHPHERMGVVKVCLEDAATAAVAAVCQHEVMHWLYAVEQVLCD